MNRTLLILMIFCPLLGLKAQTNIDSLLGIWKDESQADNIRLEAIYKVSTIGYLFSRPDSAFYFAKQQYAFAEAKGLVEHMALASITQGASFYVRGQFSRALTHYKKSLLLYEELENGRGIANSLGNIGLIYMEQGNYSMSLTYYHRCLNLFEELDYPQGAATAMSNIATIYMMQKDYPKAQDYCERTLAKYEEQGDKGGVASMLNNMGVMLKEQGNYPQALENFRRSLEINKEFSNKRGITYSLNNIGVIHGLQGLYTEALSYCKNGLESAESIGSLTEQKNACQCLYDTYKAMGKGNDALLYLEKLNAVEDSMQADETAKKLQQMEFDKQLLADSLAKAEEARLVEEAHREEIRKKNQTRNWSLAGGLFGLLLALGFYARWRYVRRAKAVIEIEKDRSDNLLLNILPAEIAQELKEEGRAKARNFDKVSILFSDFKEFTQASEKLSATELVNEINTCFEAFDAIMEKYGIEKIKTIGDAYMAAGGLPIPSENSVKNTVRAALEMQAFISDRKESKAALGEPAFEMRVGIHTGPVVAGIVGVKKFQYDIWGDTVNTANRMESSGEVGKVNISQSTYEWLKEEEDFVFENRGMVAAKGKGEMEMLFVSLKENTKEEQTSI